MNRSITPALKNTVRGDAVSLLLSNPLSPSPFFLPLSQFSPDLNKSVVTRDIVSVGQSTIKMKENLWMTLWNN